MELPRVAARLATVLALLVALLTAVIVPAALAAGPASAATATDPNTPVLVPSQTTPPRGYRLNARQVLAAARRAPVIVAELHRHPRLIPYEYTKGPGRWQVSWFTPGTNAKELAQVYVDDASGRVTEAWTGFQVAWTMARGYPGAFGRRVNAWYVWLPMCVLFAAPFLPWRRRPGLIHLDIAVLLAFSISLAFFNHARIGLSVPLVYPPLVYLLARMLFLAAGRGRPRAPLKLLVPASWLAVGVVFLVGFRVGLDVANSNVIDVGYAGVIGADKLIHGHPLYGGWPKDNANGDTYGPVNYYAYVPFRAIFGFGGAWDSLPAAHAAAIAFDLLTLIGLFFLGRLTRGPTAGIVLAYAWASYPFTFFALSSNSNDTLVALLIVLALLVVRWAPARGAASALAGLTKFAPLALAPLFLRGIGRRPTAGQALAFVLAFAVTIAVAMIPVLGGDLHAFWRDTISYQADRASPFSIWGLWGGLGVEQHLVQGAAAGLAIVVAFVPRRRGMLELSALTAAVVIALQLGITHWFYLYIPWFFAPLMLALLLAHPPGEDDAGARGAATERPAPARAPAQSTAPALAQPPG